MYFNGDLYSFIYDCNYSNARDVSRHTYLIKNYRDSNDVITPRFTLLQSMLGDKEKSRKSPKRNSLGVV